MCDEVLTEADPSWCFFRGVENDTFHLGGIIELPSIRTSVCKIYTWNCKP